MKKEIAIDEMIKDKSSEEDNIFTHRIFVPLLALFACFLWGSAFPSLKISYQELMISGNDIFTKMLFAGYRFLLASLFLFVWRLFSKGNKSIKVDKANLPFLIVLGLMQTTLQYFFFYNGLANTTGVKGSVLVTLGIFFTVIISHFIYNNDKIDRRKVLGLAAGFLGVIIVNLSKGSFNFSFKLTGEGFIIMSAVTSTIAAVMVKNSKHQLEPILLTAYQMLIGSLFLIAISTLGVHPFSLDFNLKSTLLIFYLAFVSAAGFGLWYSLIKYNKLGYISIYKFMVPISGALLSALLLPEEGIYFNTIIALILVSFGIIMINVGRENNSRVKSDT